MGFLQVRNEVRSGHLKRYLDHNSELFDKLYAIDDASDDETVEVLLAAGAVVIKNSASLFQEESSNKERLLSLLKDREEDGTVILWLDSDEVLYCSRAELNSLVSRAISEGYDSISLSHLNLWRSNFHHRLDDNYHSLKPVRLWVLSRRLSFAGSAGLHGQTHPVGLVATMHSSDFPVFHYGFASLDCILEKYASYYLLWQSGYALDRLVDESSLEVQNVALYAGSLGARWARGVGISGGSDEAPSRLSPYEWQLLARRARRKALERSKPKVTVVCLIFKSVDWLEFAYGELLRLRREFRRGEVELLFVANDPTEKVIDFLRENAIPHHLFKGRKDSAEWYINSVYRAYNFGVEVASAEYVYLVNSDMAFAPGALRKAMAHATDHSLVATRLVESGRLPSGELGIEKDFGAQPRNFRRREFLRFAKSISKSEVVPGGLFMPLLVNRATFLQLGGFPEGNLSPSSLDVYLNDLDYEVATQGQLCIPGDQAFMSKAKKGGVSHVTAMDSLAYHFQEGELASTAFRRRPSGVLVLNDRITGVNKEVTLWNRLLHYTQKMGIGYAVSLEGEESSSKLGIAVEPLRLFFKALRVTRNHPVRVVFANATFQIPFPFAVKSLILLQDRPKAWHLRLLQRASVQLANQVLTNDLSLVGGRSRVRTTWIEIATNVEGVGLDSDSAPPSRSNNRIRGIFVGAFNETKGEGLLGKIVSAHPEIEWTLVSKRPGDIPRFALTPNIRVVTSVAQETLYDMVRQNDFLISTSPHETQHLASLEAVRLNVPVFITPTGLLGAGVKGKRPYGFVSTPESFDGDFESFLSALSGFNPLEWIQSLWSEPEDMLFGHVFEMLEASFEEPKADIWGAGFVSRLSSFGRMQLRALLRQRLVPLARRLNRFVRFR